MKVFSYTGKGVSTGCTVLAAARSDLTAAKQIKAKLTSSGLEADKSLLDIRQSLEVVTESLDSPTILYFDNGDY